MNRVVFGLAVCVIGVGMASSAASDPLGADAWSSMPAVPDHAVEWGRGRWDSDRHVEMLWEMPAGSRASGDGAMDRCHPGESAFDGPVRSRSAVSRLLRFTACTLGRTLGSLASAMHTASDPHQT